ncbi:MAG: hypothetical protein WC269_05235, partial [Candidatus Gracilibacteria bacterium]
KRDEKTRTLRYRNMTLETENGALEPSSIKKINHNEVLDIRPDGFRTVTLEEQYKYRDKIHRVQEKMRAKFFGRGEKIHNLGQLLGISINPPDPVEEPEGKIVPFEEVERTITQLVEHLEKGLEVIRVHMAMAS